MGPSVVSGRPAALPSAPMAKRATAPQAADAPPDGFAMAAAAALTQGASVADTEGAAGAPPEDTPPAGSGTDQRDQESTGSTTDDADHWRTEAKEARSDAAKYRRQLRDLQAQVAQMQEQSEQGKTEGDDARVREAVARERAERDKLAERLKGVALRASVAAAAADLNIVDPDAALALLDRSAVEWAGDEPDDKSVRAALTELLDAKPYLKRQPPAGIAPAGSGREGGATGSQPAGETDDQRRARLYGGGAAAIWDPRRAAEQGGGVVGF